MVVVVIVIILVMRHRFSDEQKFHTDGIHRSFLWGCPKSAFAEVGGYDR
jgi:hypothetical protein